MISKICITGKETGQQGVDVGGKTGWVWKLCGKGMPCHCHSIKGTELDNHRRREVMAMRGLLSPSSAELQTMTVKQA